MHTAVGAQSRSAVSASGVLPLCPTLAAPLRAEPGASCTAVPMSAGQEGQSFGDGCCLSAAPDGVSGLS